MKRSVVVSFILLAAVASAMALVYSFNNKRSSKHEIKKSTKPGFAIVELFTSEGCSSCPPADAAVAKLLSKKLENVYILSFHVDYWNRLGWDDPFSQPQFSARQRRYANHFSLNSVYTPQVVVNGALEFIGSDVTKLNNAVEAGLSKAVPSELTIETKRTGNTLMVTYQIAQKGVLLNLALVQPEATTAVKKGENSGRTLHHVNVVRALHTADVAGKGYLTIEIPNELTNDPLQLIVYTQAKENFRILGAQQKNV